MIKELQNWEVVTNKLTEYFIKKYFGNPDKCDWYWIGDKIGTVLCVGDYFFDLSDIIYFIECKYSKAQLFTYYEHRLDCQMKKKTYTNIENWKKLIKSKLKMKK